MDVTATETNSLDLPTSRATSSAALRENFKNTVSKKWREVPPSHFTRVWRDKFTASIPKLTRSNLRKVDVFLTGHSTLNYILNKNQPDKFPKTCPHCLADEETVIHFASRCPRWSAERSAFLTLSTSAPRTW